MCSRSTELPFIDTSRTPSASEIRKKPASAASSLSGVTRLMAPAASATIKATTRPPRLIAHMDRPKTRNPSAAPGRMACDMASPIRLMRRSTRKTPIGPALIDRARHATSARRMKPNSMNGWISASYSMASARADRGGRIAPAGSERAGPRQVLIAQRLRRGPHATSSRAISSASGNSRFTCSRSCKAAITVRPSPCQVRTTCIRSAVVF